MPNAISYSLFGYKQNHTDGFSFSSYLRGLSMNLQMAELLYPGWQIYLAVDEQSYDSPFKPYFDYHAASGRIHLEILPPDELCAMMLWRMRPVFMSKYDRVLCRDIDSLVCHRERQAVEYWIQSGRAVHAITDSVSHTIALMGGMIGFMNKEFRGFIHCRSFAEMRAMAPNFGFKVKGADQSFLNKYILPRVADTMCEHYVLGMRQSFRGECFNYIQDIPVPGVDELMRESNHLVEHIGQAGFICDPVLKFLDAHLPADRKQYYKQIEEQFKEVHYWLLEV